ncbi:hypothetical protein FNV43_RR23196 [Rhamnella rubrinervis]|uniref:Uncharacterized protein n=1 Tax=Rhamnella rubrinervis TaxID=2594499 RepID=A0A8K0GRU5_9ROSA|nr:hypothetical protein FNV43_RR23196 [Rhamnella rubrinervis]
MVLFRSVSLLSELRSHVTSSDLDLHSQLKELIPEQQIDLEKAKAQEIAKLETILQEMQGQLDEAHAAIIHEKEAAKLAIEEAPPIIKEVPVVDETKLEILRNHNEELEIIESIMGGSR